MYNTEDTAPSLFALRMCRSFRAVTAWPLPRIASGALEGDGWGGEQRAAVMSTTSVSGSADDTLMKMLELVTEPHTNRQLSAVTHLCRFIFVPRHSWFKEDN